MFDMLSLNVRGIREKKKRINIFSWVRNHVSDQGVIMLQETHSTKDLESSWSSQLQCEKVYYSHGESNARGVLIAFQNHLDVTIKQKVCDENGRFIVLKCIIQDSSFLIINLYNSNNEGEQVGILNRITDIIESIDPDHTGAITMGGDFNFIQDINLDLDGGSPKPKYSSISAVAKLQNLRDLVDIWRLHFCYTRRYAFRQPNPFLQRRLDYFLISDFLQDHTKHVDIIPAVNTDHSAIVLQLSKIEGPIRGPSYWKFNNSLLDDNNYINGMRDERSRFLNSEYSHSDPRIYWEVLKFKIKTFSRNFSINKKRISKKAREQLELKLKKLSAAITTSSDNSLLKEYEDSKHTLEDLYDSITNGLIIRSKVEWYEKAKNLMLISSIWRK